MFVIYVYIYFSLYSKIIFLLDSIEIYSLSKSNE